MNHTHYIGMDVHNETVAVAWAGATGQPEFHGNCASSLRTVEDTLRRLAKKLGTGFKELKAGS